MKAYLMTTGVVFGAIVVAHVARVFAEGTRLLGEPDWVILTLLAAALCVGAFRLLARTRRADPSDNSTSAFP
jgi:hypothetical protein